MTRIIDLNIDINAPQELVWEITQAFDRRVEWDMRVVEAQLLSDGPIGKGTRWRIKSSFYGLKSWVDSEFLTFNPPRHSGAKSVDFSRGNPLRSISGSWHYRSTGENKSNFHTRLSVQVKGGRLVEKLVGDYLVKLTKKSLQNLKTLAEKEYLNSLDKRVIQPTTMSMD